MLAKLQNRIERNFETYGFCGSSCLICCDFFDCALDLDQVDVLVPQLDHAVEDGLNFGELVLVAGDEVEVGRYCGGHGNVAVCFQFDVLRLWSL